MVAYARKVLDPAQFVESVQCDGSASRFCFEVGSLEPSEKIDIGYAETFDLTKGRGGAALIRRTVWLIAIACHYVAPAVSDPVMDVCR